MLKQSQTVPRFEEVLAEYYERELANRKERSVRSYCQSIRQFNRWCKVNGLHWLNLTLEDCEDWRLNLKQSAARRNNMIHALRSWFKFLIRKEYYKENLAKKLETFTIHHKVLPTPKKEEIESFIRTAKEPYSSLVLFQMCTGARREEICSLVLTDIDLAEKKVIIKGKAKGKGKKERQLTNLPEKLIAALKHYLGNIRPKSELDLFFLMAPYRKLPERRVNPDVYNRYLKRHAGFTTHALRRYFITDLVEKGEDSIRISLVSGHADPKTIKDHYVHRTEKLTSDIMSKTSIRAEEIQEEEEQKKANDLAAIKQQLKDASALIDKLTTN